MKDSLPVLDGIAMRIIHEQFYSTKIFSYKAKRDSSGMVILNGKGYPELDDFKVLKIAGPGEND